MIIYGVAGILFNYREISKLIDYYSYLLLTASFFDGNHEKLELANSYPTEMWKGGKDHRILDTAFQIGRRERFSMSRRHRNPWTREPRLNLYLRFLKRIRAHTPRGRFR